MQSGGGDKVHRFFASLRMTRVLKLIEMRYSTAFMVAISLLMAAACEPCENGKPVEYRSPDGAWKVVAFERGCGATVGQNLQMSVLPATNPLPNQAGNTFVIDSNHGVSALQYVYIDWISNNSVRITYPSNARVFKQERRVGSVDVTYISK
jgi:hypothetical protein